jgi:amino acid transporter
LCLGFLALITLLNLRGLGASARAFLLPTLLFIVGLLAIIAVGLIHPLGLHDKQPGQSLLSTHGLQVVSVLLILKAFSAGCSALTGVEAIANGVPLFKQPRARRAKHTEVMLGSILGAMLLGLAILAQRWHVGPRSGQTVLSQIMGMAVGRHWAYYVVSLTITVVLALAANTSFGGLPILTSLLARDNFLPHFFGLRGDRQVFGNGIWVLAILSAALLVAVGGNTNTMIPLFAIGVFTGFTLSQTGLVVHWWRTRPDRWHYRAAVNGLGAMVTLLATVIFLISKFQDGAWVVVIAIPAFVILFLRIHAYYGRVAEEVIALYVSLDYPDEERHDGADIEALWRAWSPGPPLEVLHTEFASVVEPVVEYIERLRAKGDRQIVVLIPVVEPRRIRYRLLHNHIDLVLSAALRKCGDVVVARVRMPLKATPRRPRTKRRA